MKTASPSIYVALMGVKLGSSGYRYSQHFVHNTKTQKQPVYSSIIEKINTFWYNLTVEYYIATERTRQLPHANMDECLRGNFEKKKVE